LILFPSALTPLLSAVLARLDSTCSHFLAGFAVREFPRRVCEQDPTLFWGSALSQPAFVFTLFTLFFFLIHPPDPYGLFPRIPSPSLRFVERCFRLVPSLFELNLPLCSFPVPFRIRDTPARDPFRLRTFFFSVLPRPRHVP